MPDPAVLLDSWPWKIAIAVVILAVREMVRRFPLGNPKSENRRAVLETIDSAALTVVLVLFVVQPFILQPFKIPSGSMENTLQVDDRILVSKFLYRLRAPQRGDAIVFRAVPSRAKEPDETWIKRCIGTPGQVITIINNRLTVDGVYVPQPYTYWDEQGFTSYDLKIIGGVVYARDHTDPESPGRWAVDHVPVDEPLQSRLDMLPSQPIPPGKLLMLGDHRNDSDDGHYWGLLDQDRVVGKAICVFWPPRRWGTLDRMSEKSDAPTRTSDGLAVASG